MVCSQVYSQDSSHCNFPNAKQHRYGAPSNAEVCCREPETKEANWVGNASPDVQLLSSKSLECAGYADSTSPYKSSWITRLIPSHSARVDQPQPSDKSNKENHNIDGLQIKWKENAGHASVLGNQSNFPVYENSRRSKQDFFSIRQIYLGAKTGESVQNDVNIRPFEASNALPPEVQVSPKPLPIVESLLPGNSKKGTENQISRETNMPHILFRCMGPARPTKQTVHYSADEKSRVFCSSIEGLKSHSVVHAAGDLLALSSSQMVEACVRPTRPSSEFPFGSIVGFSRSTYVGKGMQSGTNLRTRMNSTQTGDPLITSLPENRYCDLRKGWASSMPRCQSVENRMSAGYIIPHREGMIETDEGLPYGLSMDQLPSSKTISKRTLTNPKEHESYAHDGSEALYAKDGSCEIGWQPILNTENDDLRLISNLGPLHREATVAKEKAGTSLSHHVIEQDFGSLHGSREEPGGTSRSFSFQFENQLTSASDYAKVVTCKGHWPFCRSALSNDNLAQSRWSEDNVDRGLAAATRPGLPCDNSFIFPETGVCKAETAYMCRSQASPLSRMERLNGSSSHGIFDNHNFSPYKAPCIDIGGVCKAEMKTQPLPCNSVDQTEQTLQGMHSYPLFRLESNSMIEGMERKELRLPFPSKAVHVKNWKAFRPSITSGTQKCSPEGAGSNHADANCVSATNWKAFKLPNRSRMYACPPEGAQSNHADGNLCHSIGSIGSCSKGSSNLSSEDAFIGADARSGLITDEKSSLALQMQRPGVLGHIAGSGVNRALDDQESEGKEAISWGASGLAVKQNVWLGRWSSLRPRKYQAVSRANIDVRALTGMSRARNYTKKEYCTSHGSRESFHRFDLRPAKRMCYEKGSGLQPGNAISEAGSFAMGREHTEKGATPHFMKRFLTPSAAAMAIMGMTARKVHAPQPQGRGLFGDWASNPSTRKFSGAKVEVCKKEVCTRTNCKKEILQSAVQVPPTSVNL